MKLKEYPSRFASHVFYIDADVARRRRQTGNCHPTSASFYIHFVVVVIVGMPTTGAVVIQDDAKLTAYYSCCCCYLTVVLSLGQPIVKIKSAHKHT